MAGLYVHIPFCRRACVYCDFHFNTSMRHKSAFCKALAAEARLRKGELEETFSTLYFGGGTPSQLNPDELNLVLEAIYPNYFTEKPAEFTFELNPEDATYEYLVYLKQAGVNRLSMGVQSFDETMLRYMKREHSVKQVYQSLDWAAKAGFERISIDLIYGIPAMNDSLWLKQLSHVHTLPINHLSCYALTVEEGTLLHQNIKKGKTAPVDDQLAAQHFALLQNWVAENNWDHYEVSNLGKPGCRALHNSNYWNGTPYLGLGPSAHTLNGKIRRINKAHNQHYIFALPENDAPHELEVLSERDEFNELIIIGLRTSNGISISQLNGLNAFHTEKLLQKIKYQADAGIEISKEGAILLNRALWFESDRFVREWLILESEWA
jgi:oxygen-independent coproporphyrinogen-3 oxidase